MEYEVSKELEVISEAEVVTLKLGASLVALRSQEHFSVADKFVAVLVCIEDVWSAKAISLAPQMSCC